MLCQWIIRIFALLYLCALALLIIGTFGFFGQEQDPLAGIFLIPFGLPWVLATGALPEPMLPWVAVLAPALNIALLSLMCRWFSQKKGQPKQ